MTLNINATKKDLNLGDIILITDQLVTGLKGRSRGIDPLSDRAPQFVLDNGSILQYVDKVIPVENQHDNDPHGFYNTLCFVMHRETAVAAYSNVPTHKFFQGTLIFDPEISDTCKNDDLRRESLALRQYIVNHMTEQQLTTLKIERAFHLGMLEQNPKRQLSRY